MMRAASSEAFAYNEVEVDVKKISEDLYVIMPLWPL